MDSNEEKKTYEISFLVVQAGNEAELASVLKQHDAEVLYKSPLNELRLSYPIRKYKQGYFGFLHCSTKPENVDKIVKALKLNPAFLRVLVITPPVGGKTERTERRERSKIEKSEPTPSLPPQKGALSNEALEQKLEEILK